MNILKRYNTYTTAMYACEAISRYSSTITIIRIYRRSNFYFGVIVMSENIAIKTIINSYVPQWR
jgi:hypothetical protein